MEKSKRKRIRKYFFWLLILFVVMFVTRLTYGYFKTEKQISGDSGYDFFNSVNDLRKNYASDKKIMKSSDASIELNTPTYSSSQKYEKISTLKANTHNFEKDESDLRKMVTDFSAIIQYEQNSGNKGQRELQLMVGVIPDKFDAFNKAVQKIGIITSKEVTKVDKTNEYRQLNARKLSLEKTLTSLNELKNKPGAVTDFVDLHDKILEIEGMLQELGVELGNFDTENEFCTVRFSLHEKSEEVKISFFYRVMVALQWTIKYYALLVLSLFAGILSIALLVFVVDKIKYFKTVYQKKD